MSIDEPADDSLIGSAEETPDQSAQEPPPKFEELGNPEEWPELFPPPRAVPRALRWYLVMAGAVSGAALVFVSSLLWLPLLMHLGWLDDQRVDAEPVTAPGQLIALDSTPVFGGRRPITCYRYRYRFTLPDGREVHGVSYDYRRLGTENRRPGAAVLVQYSASQPESNRLEQTQAGLFAFWPTVRLPALAVGLFGFWLVIRGARTARRSIRLLSHGEVAPDDQITKLRDAKGSPLTHRDLGAMEPVLFDPTLPGLGLAVRRIEGLRITAAGEWRADYTRRALLNCLLLLALFGGGPVLVGMFMLYTG
jgi:hypothetical protein